MAVQSAGNQPLVFVHKYKSIMPLDIKQLGRHQEA